jgi:hypothetical protein
MIDLETPEQNKILELFDSVALLLKSDLVQRMDQDTLDLLSQMRDVIQAWVQGSSELSHEQILATIANLTASLNREKSILLDEGNKSLH